VENNYIYSVGSIGQNWGGGGLLQPQNTSILVCKSDTMANIIWKKSYGGDMYYRPVSIIHTLDSGLLVSGIRYSDAQTSFLGVGESFILKLDKNGDLVSVGVKENNSVNFVTVKCYPNPTTDAIYFDVPFGELYEIEIYDTFGRLVYDNDEYLNLKAIDTHSLSCGSYYYKIKIRQGMISGKFMKQ
jgi:hypothetical protein